jgi:hypothetical protein
MGKKSMSCAKIVLPEFIGHLPPDVPVSMADGVTKFQIDKC